MRPKTIKFLEETTGSNLFDISQRNIFLDMSPLARETKAKLNYWDYNKIKSFYIVKEAINKMKSQPIKQGKILANDISSQGLISKIYKELT